MEEKLIKEALGKYKTPFYMFSVEDAEKTISGLRNKINGRANLCYAMKANPFMVRYIEPYVDRIEVCSMGEFEICNELGINKEKVLISGVLKEEEDIIRIMDTFENRCCYTIESPEQYRLISDWASNNQKKMNVYFRLTSGNQFGMDEETIDGLLKAAADNNFIEVRGIHFFSGTQKKVKRIKDETQRIKDYFIKMKEAGHEFGELEYGPGMAVSYFEGQKEPEEYFDYLDEFGENVKITIELGRRIAAECGVYVTTIKDIKTTSDVNYCIVDGGIHQMNYDGQLRGMYNPDIRVIRKDGIDYDDNAEMKKYVIAGSLCTTNDILVSSKEFTNPQINDVLAFYKTGAYSVTEGMLMFLSHRLPAIIINELNGNMTLLRENIETYKFNM